MNQKGGAIEIFTTLAIALFLIGLFAINVQPNTYPLTTSSTWSGTGTLPNVFLAGTVAILVFVLFYWSLKENVRGYQNI